VTLVLRIGLAVLAVVELVVGAWNQLSPRTFYDDFPTVDLTPPFAEHYARDFGGATLGIGIVLAAAALMPRTVLVVPALLGVTAFGIPHFVFHLQHLEHTTAGEGVFLVASTGLVAWAPPVLLVVAVLRMSRDLRARRASDLRDPPLG
jgi:hypothetical protein